jgi:lipopolysaccharide export system ATP-binding protein
MAAPVLKVDSVELSFDDRKILQDVHLSCRPGQIIGLLGRNGCGKSSLLKIIFGTLRPTFKHVSINGEFIHKGYHKGRIAYLPQHNYLPDGIKISKLSRMLVDENHWEQFAALDIYNKYADSIVSQLSGGEVRQLETLMIIFSKADFILLDEPFTHISPIQAETFKQVIRECAKTKGIILTDHQYYNIIEISDNLILLNNGHTRHLTSPDDLVMYGYLSGI